MTAAERLAKMAQETERLNQRRWDNARKAAWAEAARIFPTDYAHDAKRSERAGYPVYRSTAEDHEYFYICDLGDSLELNMGARTVRLPAERFFDANDTAAIDAAVAACNAALRGLAAAL